jgi:uncharacterized protein (DUF4415 family)
MKRKSRTDWAAVDAMTDDEIDYSEIPELDEEFFRTAVVLIPPSKASVTLRLDRDVLNWFKEQGAGYQTRINALLRAYMVAQRQNTKHP